eukprot:COSAG01_NODE_8255_length_2855_cov_5.639695_5_plen_130_part_00
MAPSSRSARAAGVFRAPSALSTIGCVFLSSIAFLCPRTDCSALVLRNVAPRSTATCTVGARFFFAAAWRGPPQPSASSSKSGLGLGGEDRRCNRRGMVHRWGGTAKDHTGVAQGSLFPAPPGLLVGSAA